ncbi:hypothetical protein CAJAP_05212 [Camponotus japonicus]
MESIPRSTSRFKNRKRSAKSDHVYQCAHSRLTAVLSSNDNREDTTFRRNRDAVLSLYFNGKCSRRGERKKKKKGKRTSGLGSPQEGKAPVAASKVSHTSHHYRCSYAVVLSGSFFKS